MARPTPTAYEHETGVVAVIEMGARIYNPAIGRFLQVDPILGGTSNDYTYVDDPINWFDTSGLSGYGGNAGGKGPALSAAEREALDNFNARPKRPYDAKAYNRAIKKLRSQGKYSGEVNKQKKSF